MDEDLAQMMVKVDLVEGLLELPWEHPDGGDLIKPVVCPVCAAQVPNKPSSMHRHATYHSLILDIMRLTITQEDRWQRDSDG